MKEIDWMIGSKENIERVRTLLNKKYRWRRFKKWIRWN